MIEYNPAQPFRSGSPSTAQAARVEAVVKSRQRVQSQRRAIAQRVAADWT